MTPGLPPWPTGPVAHGPVMLRRFSARDVPMARELSTDPYVPFVGTLPANASREQASDWVDRQRGRWELAEASALAPVVGASYPLARIADAYRHVDAGHKKGTIVVAMS